jgi:hypothetical protein
MVFKKQCDRGLTTGALPEIDDESNADFRTAAPVTQNVSGRYEVCNDFVRKFSQMIQWLRQQRKCG